MIQKKQKSEINDFKFKNYSENKYIDLFQKLNISIPLYFAIFFIFFKNITNIENKINIITIIFIGVISCINFFTFILLINKSKKDYIASGAIFWQLYFVLLIAQSYLSMIISNIFLIDILFKFITILLSLFFVENLFKRIISTFKKFKWKILTISLLSTIFLLLMMYILSFLLKLQPKNQNTLVEEFAKSFSNKIIIFILVVFIAPFFEEIIFRNLIFSVSKNNVYAIITSSLLFGFSHGLNDSLINNIPYLVSGLVFGFIFIYTKNNITFTIVSHLLTNLVVFIIMCF